MIPLLVLAATLVPPPPPLPPQPPLTMIAPPFMEPPRIRDNEEIIMDPYPFDTNLKYRPLDPNDPDYLLDPFVWA